MLRVPSGKIRNELPAANRFGGAIDRGHRRFAAIAFDRNEAARDHHRSEHRQLRQLGLEEHMQSLMQRLEQHRRIDVAFVIRAEHYGAVGRNVFATANSIANAGESQREANPDVSGNVERGLVLEAHTDRERNRPGNQDVNGDDEVGRVQNERRQ